METTALSDVQQRHTVQRLIAAAVAADVGLEELQVLLDILPASALSNKDLFVLIKTFMHRQQYPEAAHCYQRMETAGLGLATPALEVMLKQLTARNLTVNRESLLVREKITVNQARDP